MRKVLDILKKGIDLQKWFSCNDVSDEMLWKKSYVNQVIFVRDDLNGLMQNCLEGEDRISVKVISTHISKSITLPVYHLQRKNLNIILRENFYNWKMSVISSNPIVTDFQGLFHTTPPIEPDYTGDELSSVYFEGFPEELVFRYYEEQNKYYKTRFSAKISSDYILYIVIYLILKSQGYITPMVWHTKESHQKELTKNAERRKINEKTTTIKT